MHDYKDETPVEMFGLENNCQISIWSKIKLNDDSIILSKDKSSYPRITNKVSFTTDLPKIQTFLDNEIRFDSTLTF